MSAAMGDMLLAAVLLNTPPSVPEPEPSLWRFVTLRSVVVPLAVEWGVLDESEVRLYLTDPQSYPDDMARLRRRREELADAPPSSDAHRFPPRAVLSEACSFNRRYHQSLAARCEWELDRRPELEAAMAEATELYRVYDLARDAACEHYSVLVRRRALKELRDRLGDGAYSRGELPPPAPYHRFNELK